MQDFLPRVVSKAHVFHFDQPIHTVERHGPARLIILQLLVQDFASTLEAGDGLRDLRPDGHALKDRRHQQS